jgi:pimeloyl-ACP methyl ester carboxylesterase
MFLVHNINKIYINVGNKGETIIFLHGWGVYKETWKNLFTELSKHYTIYALDLPGFGNNQDTSSKFALEDYVKFLKAYYLFTHSI